jgi:MFS transporter, DHA1 family, inner membrane transport protein
MTNRFAPTALMLGNFVTGLAIMSPTGMLSDLATGLGVSVRQAGLLITFGAAVLCVGSPLMTWLTSRTDRRWLLAMTMLGIGVTHLAVVLVSDYATMMGLRLVMLAIAAAYTPMAASTAALLVPEERRAGTIVYVFLGWSLAFAFGMPMVTFAAAHVGWRETLVGIGVLALLIAPLILACLPRGLIGSPVLLSTWAVLARNRLVVLLLLITTLQVSGQFCVFTFLGPLLSKLTQASPEWIGVSFGLFGVCGFVGNVLALRIVSAIGAFWTSMIYLSVLVLGSAIWCIGSSAGMLAILLLSSAVWGSAFAAMNSMQQTRLVGAAPEFSGASVSLNTSVLYVGQAIGSGVGGWLYERGDLIGNGYASLAFIVLALVVLALTRPSRVAVLAKAA